MGSDYINLLSLPMFYLFDADLSSILMMHSSLLLQLNYSTHHTHRSLVPANNWLSDIPKKTVRQLIFIYLNPTTMSGGRAGGAEVLRCVGDI